MASEPNAGVPNEAIEQLRKNVEDVKRDLKCQGCMFRILADCAPVGLYLDDPQGRAIYINQKCAELVGMPAEAALDFNWMETLHPEDTDRMVGAWKKAFTNSEPFYEEYRWLHKDGTIVWTLGEVIPLLDEEGKAYLFVGTLTDITRHKEAEEAQRHLELQFSQAQKMDSIGRLAGGVAHDFNNMLNVITGYAEMAQLEVQDRPAVMEMLDEILKAANRSADVTRKLLDFSRKEMVTTQVFNLSQAVNEMYNMLRHVLGEEIEFFWYPSPRRLPVQMDRAQLDQMVMNLCLNARDAMENHGTITLRASRIPWSEAKGILPFAPPKGECACLTISDTGCGMEHDVLDKIYEPFFTTKDQHEGTGLGLASVYANVQQSGGHIHVSSTPGVGTQFEIYLPLIGS